MSSHFAYTVPFKNSDIDKLRAAAACQINASAEREIKAWARQAHLIVNIWTESLGGGIELSLCSAEPLHSLRQHGGPWGMLQARLRARGGKKNSLSESWGQPGFKFTVVTMKIHLAVNNHLHFTPPAFTRGAQAGNMKWNEGHFNVRKPVQPILFMETFKLSRSFKSLPPNLPDLYPTILTVESLRVNDLFSLFVWLRRLIYAFECCFACFFGCRKTSLQMSFCMRCSQNKLSKGNEMLNNRFRQTDKWKDSRRQRHIWAVVTLKNNLQVQKKLDTRSFKLVL